MSVQIKRFNWVRSPSAWENAQAWRERRSAATQEFLSNSASFNTAFAQAHINQTGGMVSITGQVLAERVQREKQASLAASLSQIDRVT